MWIATNYCEQQFHQFKGGRPYHVDDQLCQTIEYSLREEEDSADICPDCGHTPATGACFRCKMD